MKVAESPLRETYESVIRSLNDAAATSGRTPPCLVAVAKTRPPADIAALHALGQRAFGENYVQEAAAKQDALAGLDLEWHLIGHLQTNKCRDAAARFDWVQTVDRPRLVTALDRARPDGFTPLNVLIQVNVDAEAGKSGCRPEEIDALADAIVAAPRLRLRGLMAIPAPSPDPAVRRAAFAAMRVLFDALRARHAGVDTLSMGMSEDAELAVAEGATLVRIGSRLFGPRG